MALRTNSSTAISLLNKIMFVRLRTIIIIKWNFFELSMGRMISRAYNTREKDALHELLWHQTD